MLMLGNDLPCGDSRSFYVCMELFGLDDPIVGVEGVLAAEGADLILLAKAPISKSNGKFVTGARIPQLVREPWL